MNQTIGILAHVDAGKTTFAEQLLYHTGSIRRFGRVDHQDTFLDTHRIERQRGITIFSGQAVFSAGGKSFDLLDTPGHADFSAEMERAVQVMDYAVLIVSCVEGVQGHTETVWRILAQHCVPVFFFLNKTDREGADPSRVLDEIRCRLTKDAVCFDGIADGKLPDLAVEAVAERDDRLLEYYLENGYQPEEWDKAAVRLIRERKLFPCLSGSALQDQGIDLFLECLVRWTETAYDASAPFCADVYRVRYDEKKTRRTYLKIRSGTLRAKDEIAVRGGEGPCFEKVNELRVCHGDKAQPAAEVGAGALCVVSGLSLPKCGDRIGSEFSSAYFEMKPMLTARVVFDEGTYHPRAVLEQLRILEEEDPMLQVAWDEELQEISLRVMGEIQLEILKALIAERFSLDIRFGECRILYQETLEEPVIGCGHFEPLRHYAEVHLRLEPNKRGEGIRFASECSQDVLDGNFQNLIRTHVFEKIHRGVLTGAPLTDVRITLLTGRAHLKHTEGGDFREATYRAIRQGLRKGKSVLLEPYYRFTIDAPDHCVGRLIADIQRFSGSFDPPRLDGHTVRLTGRAPVSELRGYQRELISLTGGSGSLNLTFDGYEPCHNQQEAIEQAGYDPDHDAANTADSVFCSHGAGYPVRWQEADGYMHCK